MNLEDVRTHCLAKPHVTEGLPFGPGVLVFKVCGKMFLLCSLDREEATINVKCDPERAIELREEYEEVQPGYHMNKQHWNTVHLKGRLRSDQIREMIDHSYDLIVASLTPKQRMECC
jgi:predicted DNA-binding protein (MmcQ/YjbR family)